MNCQKIPVHVTPALHHGGGTSGFAFARETVFLNSYIVASRMSFILLRNILNFACDQALLGFSPSRCLLARKFLYTQWKALRSESG